MTTTKTALLMCEVLVTAPSMLLIGINVYAALLLFFLAAASASSHSAKCTVDPPATFQGQEIATCLRVLYTLASQHVTSRLPVAASSNKPSVATEQLLFKLRSFHHSASYASLLHWTVSSKLLKLRWDRWDTIRIIRRIFVIRR